jgi:hypothetical protein
MYHAGYDFGFGPTHTTLGKLPDDSKCIVVATVCIYFFVLRKTTAKEMFAQSILR